MTAGAANATDSSFQDSAGHFCGHLFANAGKTTQSIMRFDNTLVKIQFAIEGSIIKFYKVFDTGLSRVYRDLYGSDAYKVTEIIGTNPNQYNFYDLLIPAGTYLVRFVNPTDYNSTDVNFFDKDDTYIPELYFNCPPMSTVEKHIVVTTYVAKVQFAFCSLMEIRYDYNTNSIMKRIDALEEHKIDYQNILKVVDINGTVGTNCDFTSIIDCLNSITDNSYYKPYTVLVKNGVYDITGINYLPIKDYVTVQGESISKTIISNYTSSGDQNVVCFDPNGQNVHYAKIENMTLKINRGKCCIHSDSGSAIADGGTVEVSSVHLIDLVGNNYGGINLGLHSGQTFYIHDCFGMVEVYTHTSLNTSAKESPSTFRVENCNFSWIGCFDTGAYSRGFRFIAKNNTVNNISFGTSITTHNYNVWIPECSNNKIQYYILGYEPGSQAWYDRYPICDTIHKAVKNISSGTIAKEKFVKVVDDSLNAASGWAYFPELGILNYNTDAIYIGYTLDDFTTGQEGIIQISGTIPITNSNYSVGQYITLDSSGNPTNGSQSNNIGRIMRINGGTAYLKLNQKTEDVI